MLRCIACDAEFGQLETHSAADCARRLPELEQIEKRTDVVRPLRKDWKLYRADRRAA